MTGGEIYLVIGNFGNFYQNLSFFCTKSIFFSLCTPTSEKVFSVVIIVGLPLLVFDFSTTQAQFSVEVIIRIAF